MTGEGNKITLSGAMPPGENNGLGVHAKDFIAHPLELVPIVCLVSADTITHKPRTGLVYPVIQIQHWEVVPEELRGAHRDMLAAAHRNRTGAQELPFEPGDDIPLKDPFPEDPEAVAVKAQDVADDLAARRGVNGA